MEAGFAGRAKGNWAGAMGSADGAQNLGYHVQQLVLAKWLGQRGHRLKHRTRSHLIGNNAAGSEDDGQRYIVCDPLD